MLQVRCSTSRHISVNVSMRCGVHTQFQNSNRTRAATRSHRTRFLAVKAAARCAAQAPAVLHADRAGGANAGHDHGRTGSRQGHPVRENRAEGTNFCSRLLSRCCFHGCRPTSPCCGGQQHSQWIELPAACSTTWCTSRWATCCEQRWPLARQQASRRGSTWNQDGWCPMRWALCTANIAGLLSWTV